MKIDVRLEAWNYKAFCKSHQMTHIIQNSFPGMYIIFHYFIVITPTATQLKTVGGLDTKMTVQTPPHKLNSSLDEPQNSEQHSLISI